nr:MAG: ShlB/FhaC/HecB family hemolysin secretion/activation protein [Leptolyngbya sp. IPPAS B-1204]
MTTNRTGIANPTFPRKGSNKVFNQIANETSGNDLVIADYNKQNNPPEPLPSPSPANQEPESTVTPPESPESSAPAENQPHICANSEPTPPSGAETSIQLDGIEVIGSSIFDRNDISNAIQAFQQKNNLPNLTPPQIADAITELYLSQGYINSLAISVEQAAPATETIRIQVIEGQIGQILVSGTRRLNPSYICSRIQLGTNVPLNTARLEEQLRLLRVDPIFETVEASLRPEGIRGQSTLLIRVEEAPPFTASASVDNYSPPSVGSERVGIDLRHRNLTGLGDELSGSYYRSTTSGSEVFDFNYRIPLNPMNGTIQLRAAPNRNRITEAEFADLNIEGSQQLYEATYRQPIIRSSNQELALSLGFAYQNGQTFVFDQPTRFGIGPDENGVSRTSVFSFSQDYILRDPDGAWAVRSQFSLGTDLFDATVNEAPIPDGQFLSWLGQVQRAQLIGNDHLVLISADLQLTPDSLLPAQQFVIGGGQSVRGYRQNARSGDNGLRFSIEDRITVNRNESGAPVIQIAPFVDVGYVWNHPDNPNQLLPQTFLVGAGLGLLLNDPLGLDGLSLRFDYGFPFVDLDDRGDNAQDDGFYFSVRYQY